VSNDIWRDKAREILTIPNFRFLAHADGRTWNLHIVLLKAIALEHAAGIAEDVHGDVHGESDYFDFAGTRSKTIAEAIRSLARRLAGGGE
jgi:hypothetical protein